MITSEVSGGLAIIRLNRPDKRNAMTPPMLDGLIDAIKTQRASTSTRALVLSGAGEVFCAGFDLSLCRENSDALTLLLQGLSDAIVALRGLQIPVVLSAHGAAIAGGCALLGGADVVVTNADAKLGYPVVRLGISPAVSAPFLRQAIGDGAARTRLLDPNLMDGREALRIGLAHECVETVAASEPRAIALARELAAKPPSALAQTKAWLSRVSPPSDPLGALRVSLGLVGGNEERERLAAMWSKEKK